MKNSDRKVVIKNSFDNGEKTLLFPRVGSSADVRAYNAADNMGNDFLGTSNGSPLPPPRRDGAAPARDRTWSHTLRDRFRKDSLANYDFNKPDWIHLDQFHSMATVARQELYMRLQESTRHTGGPNACVLAWSMMRTVVLIVAVAMVTACMGLCVDNGALLISAQRWQWLTKMLHATPSSDSLWIGWGPFMMFCGQSMALVLLSCALTQFICPIAAGGGVPEMKTVLSGSINPQLLSFRLVVIKVLGLTLAKAAGLTVGEEGPLIHTGCAVAELIMCLPAFSVVRSRPARRLEIYACAAAAGVAASFGSAFGATLFSVEITSVAYPVSGLPRSFLAAAVVVTVYWFFGTLETYTLFTASSIHRVGWGGHDLLAWAALGVLCGLLGCIFITCIAAISKLRNYLTRKELGRSAQIRRRFIMVFLFSAVVIPLHYLELVHIDKVIGLEKHPHVLVDLMFSQQVYGPTKRLMLYLLLKMIMALLSVTLPLPVGLFSPVFLIGSIIGRCYGEILRLLVSSGRLHANVLFEPWEFALIGSAAFSAGVTRAVSTAVIVFELSPNNNLRVPLAVATLLAYFIGNRFTKDIYEALIDTGGLATHVLGKLPVEAHHISAEEVMLPVAQLPVLSLDSTCHDALDILRNWPHFNFIPVVQSFHDMLLVGEVLRHDILLAVEEHENLESLTSQTPYVLVRQEQGSGVITPSTQDYVEAPVTDEDDDFVGSMNSPRLMFIILKRGNKFVPVASSSYAGENSLSQHRAQRGPVIVLDPSPYQVVETTELQKVDLAFRQMRLDNCWVVRAGELVGMLSRRILREFCGQKERRPTDDCRELLKSARHCCCASEE